MTGYEMYFRHGRYDSTPACYLTNYALAVSAVGYSALLWRHRAPNVEWWVEHTRNFFIGKLLLCAFSVTIAGFVHQGLVGPAGDIICGDDCLVNSIIWNIVEAVTIFGGGSLICCAVAVLTLHDNDQRSRNFYLFVFACSSGLIFLLRHIFGTDYFAISGLLGDVMPNMVLVAAMILLRRGHSWSFFLGAKSELRCSDTTKKGMNFIFAAIVLVAISGAIQVFLGASCGTPCPEKCLFPAPLFNHNAAFHSLATVGFGIMSYGMNIVCGELETYASCDDHRCSLGGKQDSKDEYVQLR